MHAHPTPTDTAARAAALEILSCPEVAVRCPALARDAWAMLAQAHGRTVRLDRLGPPCHLIHRGETPPDVGDMLAHRALRIRAAIADSQARLGNARPRPLICKGAAT